jgi:hypothetical protein
MTDNYEDAQQLIYPSGLLKPSITGLILTGSDTENAMENE